MHYEPREGVDYLVNLYGVAAVAPDDTNDVISQSINRLLRQYHPDRLHGVAPEFQEKGERVARLLNRAKGILLDPKKRSAYDSILSTWEGPVSQDGTPTVRLEDHLRLEMSAKSSEEIEAIFTAKRDQVVNLVGHNPKQQALFGRMFEMAGDEEADELREVYDDALLAEDRVWAIEENDRGRLLGVVGNERYETTLEYAKTVQIAIENARIIQTEEHQRRALGGVSMQLAILAGEGSPIEGANEADNGSLLSTGKLPHYFDNQAQQLTEIAKKREELLVKRLEIFQPTYPIAEIQTEAKPNFAVGVTRNKDNDAYTWIAFSYDADSRSVTNLETPEDIRAMLHRGEYQQAYASGFNIMTFVIKDHIEPRTLLEEACNKHVQKYYPRDEIAN